jgi:hypothetical protein
MYFAENLPKEDNTPLSFTPKIIRQLFIAQPADWAAM